MEGYLVLLLIGLSYCGTNSLDLHDVDEGAELKCGNNEQYNACTNAGCEVQNCSQLGKPIPCVRLDPKFCQRGCLCREGYLRDKAGECVKKNQCQEAIQCSGNEEVSSCTNGGCDARNCSQIGRPVPCVRLNPNSCIQGCVCKPGYLWAENGKCVEKEQCQSVSLKYGEGSVIRGFGQYNLADQ